MIPALASCELRDRPFCRPGLSNRLRLPASPRMTAPSARAQKPQSQEQYDRSDCGVDDEANDSSAEVKSKAMQEPVTDERPDNTDCRIADDTEPVPLNNLARQPSGNDPDDQNDKQPLVRQMHVLPLAGRPDSRPDWRHC